MNRSNMSTNTCRSLCAAASMTRCASPRLSLSGNSTNTCFPASSARSVQPDRQADVNQIEGVVLERRIEAGAEGEAEFAGDGGGLVGVPAEYHDLDTLAGGVDGGVRLPEPGS